MSRIHEKALAVLSFLSKLVALLGTMLDGHRANTVSPHYREFRRGMCEPSSMKDGGRTEKVRHRAQS